MRIRIAIATIGILMTAQANAASVTHTFNSGDPALASEINQNFQDVINAINTAGSTSFGAEWFIAPSTNGGLTARNVIVLKEDRGGTNDGCTEDVYKVRVFFDNTENVSVDSPSGPQTPAKVWIFGFVCADRENPTQATYQSEYVYALPSSGSFENAQGVEINDDGEPDGVFENQNAFDYTLTNSTNALATAQLTHAIELYQNGETILTATSFSSLMSEFNGSVATDAPLSETFSNVAMQTFPGFTGNGGSRIRVRARDIGLIQEYNNATFDDPVFNNQIKAEAIYYRIEGVGTNGSLANTPFDGGVSSDIWFSQ